MYFNNEFVEANVYNRELIPVGAVIEGPAIVDQLDTTTVIPTGFVAKVDAYKNIIISVTTEY